MDNSQDKLLGRLVLDLSKFQDQVKEVNEILDKGIDKSGLKFQLISDEDADKAIEKLKEIKQEVSSSSDTKIDKSKINNYIDSLVSKLSSVSNATKKIVDDVNSSNSGIIDSVKKTADEIESVQNRVTENGEQQSKKLSDSIKENNQEQTSGASLGSYKEELATIQNKHNQLIADNKLDKESLESLISSLSSLGQKYSNLNEQQLKPFYSTLKSFSQELKGQDITTYEEKLDSLKNIYNQLNNSEKLNVESLDSLMDKVKELNSQYSLSDSQESKAISLETKFINTKKELIAENDKQLASDIKLYTQEKLNTVQYSRLGDEIEKISGQNKLAMGSGNASNSFMDRVKISGAYAFAAANIYMVTSAFKDAISVNEKYEASLKDLGRVLNDTDTKDLQKFGQDAINISKQFGVDIDSVQEAMTELAQSGVDNKTDIDSMTKTVMTGINTSEIKNATQMSQYLISSLKQLNLPMSDSNKLLDSWNKMADVSVSKVSDFAEATSKACAASKAFNIDMNHLNAMVSVLGDKTGATGNEIGTAVRSLESKIETPKALKVLKEYGIEVMKDKDHFKDFGDIMSQVSATLDKFGEGTTEENDILTALGGNLRRNWIDILGKNWGSIDSEAQKSADSIGYSAKKNASIMDTLEKQVEQFKTNAKEMAIALGNAGLLNELKAFVSAGKGLTQFLSDNNNKWGKAILIITQVGIALKGVYSAIKLISGKSVYNMLDNKGFPGISNKDGMNAFGGLVNFGGASTQVKAYNSAVKSLTQQIKNGNITGQQSATILDTIRDKIGLAKVQTDSYKAAEEALKDTNFKASDTGKALAEQMDKLKSAEAGATTTAKSEAAADDALNAMQKTVKASALGVAIEEAALSAGITAAISLLVYFISYLSQANERETEALQKGADLANQYKEANKSISDLANQYKQLHESGKNDDETKSQLLDVQKQLISTFGDEAKKLDLVNGDYDKQTQAINKLMATKIKNEQTSMVSDYKKAQDTIDSKGTLYGGGRGTNVLTRATIERSQLSKGIGNIEKGITGTLQQRVTILGKILDNAKSMKNLTSTQKEAVSKISDDYKRLDKNLSSAKKTTSEWNQLQEQSNLYKLLTNGKYTSKMEQMINDAKKIKDAMSSGDIDSLKLASNNYNDLYDSIEKILAGSPKLKKAFEDWASGLDTVGKKAESVSPDIQKLGNQVDDITSDVKKETGEVNNIVSSYQTLNSALNTETQGNSLDASTVMDLITKYPKLASAVRETADGYKIDEQAIRDEMKAESAGEEANINAEIAKTQATIKNVQARINAFKDEIAALQDVQKAYVSTMNQAKDYQTWSRAAHAVASNNSREKTDTSEISDIQGSLDKANQDLQNEQAQLKVLDNLGKTAGLSGMEKAQKKQEEAEKKAEESQRKADEAHKKALEDMLKEEEEAIKSIDTQIKRVDSSMSQLSTDSQGYRNDEQQEIGLIQQKINLTNQFIQKNQASLGSAGDEADSIKEKIESEQDDLISFMEEIHQKQIDILNSSVSEYENATKKIDNAITNSKSMVDLWNEGTQEKLDYIKQEADEYNQKYNSIIQEEAFLNNSINSGQYDQKTVEDLSNKLSDLKNQELQDIKELHDAYASEVQEEYQIKVKNYNDQETHIEALAQEIDDTDKNANQKKVGYYAQEENLQNNILKGIQEEKTKVEGLLQTERSDTTKQIWIEQIDKLNTDLDSTQEKLTSIKNEEESIARQDLQKSLENQEKIKENNLKLQVYGISESEWEAYRSKAIAQYTSDIETAKANVNSGDPTSVDELISKEDKLEDITNQKYSSITNWQSAYKQLHEFNINALDTEEQAIEKSDEKQQELDNKLQRQNDLLKEEKDLQDIMKEHNVQTLTQGKDGKWNFAYTYNAKSAEEKEEEVNSKFKDNEKSDKEQRIKDEEESLNLQKKNEQDLLDAADSYYNDQSSIVEAHYSDMDTLVDKTLQSIEKTNNNDWNKIITDIENGLNKTQDILTHQEMGGSTYTKSNTNKTSNNSPIPKNDIPVLNNNDQYSNTINDLLLQYRQYGRQLTLDLSKGVTDDSSKVVNSIDVLNSNLSNSLLTFIQSCVPNGKQIDTNIGTGITNNNNATIEPLKTLINNLNNDLLIFIQSCIPSGRQVDTNLGVGITNNSNSTITPLKTLISNLTNEISKFVQSCIPNGKQVDVNLGKGITDNTVIDTNAITVLINGINKDLQTFTNSCLQVGNNVDLELAKGIQDDEKNVTDIVNTLTQDVITTFRQGFGIHSPSKVMYQMGRYLMQGLVNGMSSENIQDFMKSQIGSIISTTGGEISGDVSKWLTTALMLTGAPMSWLPALEMVASRESGNPGQLGTGDPTLTNGVGVGGEFATGLMQMLPSTFQEYMLSGMNNIFDPIANAAAAIRYIQKRYVSPYNIPNWNNDNYVGYAKGTLDSSGEPSKVGEEGNEVAVLPSHSGVSTAEVTTNLNNLGKEAPKLSDIIEKYNKGDLLSSIIDEDLPSVVDVLKDKNISSFPTFYPNVRIPNSDDFSSQGQNKQQQTIHYHIENMNFPNVFDGQDVVDALNSLPNKMEQYVYRNDD